MASRGSLPSFEDQFHLLGDGHFDAVLAGEAESGARGAARLQPLCRRAQARISGSLRPWPSCLADGAVAAERAGAGEHQVADAGEAGEGFAARAAGHGEARDLGDAAGDERGGGVVAEAHAGGDAGGDGDDIFERAAEFDADDVGGRVEAEGFGGEFLLDERGDCGSLKATVTAVGWPCATSRAKLGPESAPMESRSPAGSRVAERTCVMRRKVWSSRPLVALTTNWPVRR